MWWLFLVPAVAACLTRVKPDPRQPLQGRVDELKVNLTDCWKPCRLSGPMCYPLCPAHSLEEAERLRNIEEEQVARLRVNQLEDIRKEGERRKSIRYLNRPQKYLLTCILYI